MGERAFLGTEESLENGGSSRRMVAWKWGQRNSRTLKEFLGEIGMSGRDFVTDNDEAYYQLIPKDQLLHVFLRRKDPTFPIEQDNSNIQQDLARLRR
jgi:IS1 family transposase